MQRASRSIWFLAFLVGAMPTAGGIDYQAATAIVKERVASGQHPAMVVGILEDGRTRVIAEGASGAPNGRLDGSTVFEIGSITKVFTATILADMVRRGEVKLDDPVAKYLPASVHVPTRNGRQITLEDLSSQHSGLPRLPDNLSPADAGNPYADYTEEKVFEFLSRYQLTRDIGAEFEYSNLGVGLLGIALSHRAGMSYEALVTERVLKPLGMADTRITLTDDLRSRLARGHYPTGVPAKNWDVAGIPGAGALRSTMNDMLKFAAAAMNPGGPLGAAFSNAQQPRRVVARDGSMRIGLNWFTAATGPIDIVWHNGGTGGYRSFLGLDKANRRAVIVLTNTQNGADDVGRLILMNAVQPPETRSFVTRLGNDTLSVERHTRYADHLEGDAVFRHPNVGFVHFVARYPRGDTITYFELSTRGASQPAGEPPQFERISIITDSGAQNIVRSKGKPDSVLSKRFPLKLGAMPYASITTALYDHAARRAARLHQDSIAYEEFGISAQAPNYPSYFARHANGDAAIDYGGTPLIATLDKQGRIVRVDARNTTVKSVTELVPDVDVTKIGSAWAGEQPLGPPSPRDTARGSVAGVQVIVDYGRPSKRGRSIFGGLIKLDSIWRVGANAATQLMIDAPLRIGDTTIPAGTYSLWMIPSNATSKLIVNKQHGQWGTQYDASQDLVVIPVRTTRLATSTEKLSVAVEPQGDGGVLRIMWDDREFAVSLRKP